MSDLLFICNIIVTILLEFSIRVTRLRNLAVRFTLTIDVTSQLSLIDDEGCFTRDAGDEFVGLDVLTDGADKILDHIGPDVLHADVIVHSYPYDWRTKKPVIIRASHQWFIDINSIKQKAIVSRSNLTETSASCARYICSPLLCSFSFSLTQGQHREYRNISEAESDVVLERVTRSN